MGTVIFAVGLFSCLLMYYFASNNVAFHKRLAQNHHEINMYKECEDPHVRKLISDFVEKHPFSVDYLHNLHIDDFKKYLKETDELLDNIREHLRTVA